MQVDGKITGKIFEKVDGKPTDRPLVIYGIGYVGNPVEAIQEVIQDLNNRLFDLMSSEMSK